MKLNIAGAAKKFKKWSIYKLANELDLPQQTVYSWAWGKTHPTYANLKKICDALGCRAEDLLGF